MRLFKKTTLAIACLILSAAPAPALDLDLPGVEALLPGGDSPGTGTVLLPDGRQNEKPDPLWAVRTGFKKGITGHLLADEIIAGPDAAVLKGGFFEQWAGLLTEFKEPLSIVEPWDIAGIERTKPFLIIPSGGLFGLTGSAFFKAGLAEYARSGGIVICFAQQTGDDFSGLPVPPGAQIKASGWAEDSGPLFRMAAIQARHPILSSVKKPNPSVETDGFFISYPQNTIVLLSRPDGFPTLIAYPFGDGWVVATTLFSDFSYGQGALDAEERSLVQSILLWAKAPGRLVQASPGERLTLEFAITGPEQGEAAGIKVLVFGPDRDKQRTERGIKTSVHAGAFITSVPFTYTVPLFERPGIYHIEYLLFDATGRELTPLAESPSGRFVVGQASVAAPIPRAAQPLAAYKAQIRIVPLLERAGSKVKVSLLIVPESMPADSGDFLVQVAEQVRSLTLYRGAITETFELSAPETGDRVPYALYHKSGRTLIKGTIPVGDPQTKGVLLDRDSYLPGQKTRVKVSGLGKGEITLSVLGKVEHQMISEQSSVEFTMPAGIPAGTYKLRWELRTMDNSIREGGVPIIIAGPRVTFQGVSLEKQIDREVCTVKAGFRVRSPLKLRAEMRLFLRGPDGKTIPIRQEMIDLTDGRQEIPITFAFKPSQAGMYELIYGLYGVFPDNAGAPIEPITIAAGRKLFDVGDAVLLGMTTDRPVYYEAAGPVDVTAYAYGAGKAGIEMELDGRRIKKESVDLSGPRTVTVRVPSPRKGYHTLGAKVTGEKLVSTKERPFLYGALLPDLTVTVKAPDIKGAVTPVAITVQNRGKAASEPCRVALYDGNPLKNGKIIEKIDVPPIEPGKQNVSIINWPLAKKAGARTIYAVVDPDNKVLELNKTNNTASTEVKVPDLVLAVMPQKDRLGSDETVMLDVLAVNLTSAAFQATTLTIQLVSPAGKAISSDTLPLPALAPGKEQKFERTISLVSPPSGMYQLFAQISKEAPIVSTSTGITVLPTLAVSGSLDGTPPAAAVCRPLSVRYTVKNAGNIPVLNGTLKVEIRAAGAPEPAYAKQLTFTESAKTATLDRLDIPRGQYTIVLKGTASNTHYGMNREFTLAEQALTVAAPIEAGKSGTAVPRVLILTGQPDAAVQQALLERILKQAFDQQDTYFKIVANADEFMKQAMGGMFNTYVLFEQNEMLERTDWLQERIKQGQGLVIVGDGDRSRATAEAFGFRFDAPLPDETRMLSITGESGLAISGTLPVCGKILPPVKKGSKPVAVITGDKQPAAVIDTFGKGKVLVMPFSIIRSSLDTGASPLYSAFLCSAIPSVTPERNGPGGVASGEISASSPSGPVKAKIVETLPVGSKVLWTNPRGTVKDNAVTYELTADRDVQKFLYIYQPPEQGDKSTATEVFYECGGKFVSQGKIE
jgi:hypothetical protein